MRTLANIVMKRGLFYAADFIDRAGKPRVADDAPSFTSRGAAEAWANRDKTAEAAPTPEPEVEAEAETEEDSGDVVVEVPTGEAVAEGQTPEVTVE